MPTQRTVSDAPAKAFIPAMSGQMGRGTRARTQAPAPYASLRSELRALDAAIASARILGHRSDGWSVGEILAHAADLAEVFCERINPGSFPASVTTAVRDSAGHVDLARTNELLRLANGSDGVETSLRRLDRCLLTAASMRPGVSSFWLQRLDAHTHEHLREVWTILQQ